MAFRTYFSLEMLLEIVVQFLGQPAKYTQYISSPNFWGLTMKCQRMVGKANASRDGRDSNGYIWLQGWGGVGTVGHHVGSEE